MQDNYDDINEYREYGDYSEEEQAAMLDIWEQTWKREKNNSQSGWDLVPDPLQLFTPHINPLTAKVEDIQPMFMADIFGDYLLYPATAHMFVGKPETFKSWLLLSQVGKHNVRYMDFENGVRTMKKRLKALNVPVDKGGVFCFPQTLEEVKERIDEYIITKPDVVFIDGLAGLLAMFGKDGDNNKEVDEVLVQTVLKLRDAGIATVCLEHLPKSATDLNDGFPIGAQAKKARTDVIYLLRARTDSDVVDLFASKDRHNSIYERCAVPGSPKRYGTVELIKDQSGMSVLISPERVAIFEGKEIDSLDAMKLKEMNKIVIEQPGITKTQLDRTVGGSHAKNTILMEYMEQVKCFRIDRTKSGHKLYSEKEFRPEYKPRGYFYD